MADIVFLLLFQVVLIGLNAVFASAEIAVLSVNEGKIQRLADQGDARARRLQKLTGEPARFLATIQVAITLSGFLGSAFAADNFSEPLVELAQSLGVGLPVKTLDTIAVVVITLILSYFTLIFGELVPKRIAMKKSEQLALGMSGMISGISSLFKPLVWLLSVSTNGVLRLCGVNPDEEEETVSEEEIRMMVNQSSERGAIDPEEKEFIQNVFEFDDITAGEIATHRTEVTVLSLEEDPESWARTIHESRFTLYPVCGDSPDQIVGVLNAKDFFRLRDQDRETLLAGAVRPAYFVPETIRADLLFRRMKQDGQTMAVVLDEYGGMAGIVTLYDLVEELVGELRGEVSAPRLEKLGPDRWLARGNVRLEELSEALGVEIRSEEYETLTGLVFQALGAVPPEGSAELCLETQGLRIRVSQVREHQVEQAEISLAGRAAAAI